MMKLEMFGNLVRDPEVRQPSGGGNNYTTFDVAVNNYVGTDKRTQYVHVSAFGSTGENCAKYLAKGAKVFVEGRPSVNGYKTRDGAIAASLNVAANHVEFLSRANADQGEQAAPADADGFAAVAEDDALPF